MMHHDSWVLYACTSYEKWNLLNSIASAINVMKVCVFLRKSFPDTAVSYTTDAQGCKHQISGFRLLPKRDKYYVLLRGCGCCACRRISAGFHSLGYWCRVATREECKCDSIPLPPIIKNTLLLARQYEKTNSFAPWGGPLTLHRAARHSFVL